jgi:hypothetical protein
VIYRRNRTNVGTRTFGKSGAKAKALRPLSVGPLQSSLYFVPTSVPASCIGRTASRVARSPAIDVVAPVREELKYEAPKDNNRKGQRKRLVNFIHAPGFSLSLAPLNSKGATGRNIERGTKEGTSGKGNGDRSLSMLALAANARCLREDGKQLALTG